MEVDRDPNVYEFKRVVFGDASAPFLAQFASQENDRIHEDTFPLASETVKKSTYMDNSLDSTRTLTLLIVLRTASPMGKSRDESS